MEKLTKRDFNALTTEVVKMARAISKHTIYVCTLSFYDDFVSLTIIDNSTNECACSIQFVNQNYILRDDFRRLYKVVSRLSTFATYGRMLHKIECAFMNNAHKSEYFIEY